MKSIKVCEKQGNEFCDPFCPLFGAVIIDIKKTNNKKIQIKKLTDFRKKGKSND